MRSVPLGYDAGMNNVLKRIGRFAREYVTNWIVAGAILAATGVAPERWLADLLHDAHLPKDVLHLWAAGIDMRIVLAGLGLLLIAGDIAWRRTRPVGAAEPARVPEAPHAAEPGPAAAAVSADAGLALPVRPSIAVLPFDNLSGDPEREYFSDGMADDIITRLSHSNALFVIARNSSFTYKGRAVDVKQIGRELGVRYVLEGSVRRDGEWVRIIAQLVEAETGAHIWAERYDRALADVFAVQDEISDAVAIAIGPAVANAEMHRAMRRPPEALGAWELYQQGMWHLGEMDAARNDAARGLFERAIELDPMFAAAHVGWSIPCFRLALNTRPYRWTRRYDWRSHMPARRLNSIPAMPTRKPNWPPPYPRVTWRMPCRSRGRHLPSIPTAPELTGPSEQS